MPVITVNKVVDPKIIIRKNGGPRRRRGTRGCWPQKVEFGLGVVDAQQKAIALDQRPVLKKNLS
jgi:hypothetical protein